MHGSNARNLSIQLSLTSKNALFFLLLLVSSLRQNWGKRQNRFCLEEREGGLKEKEEVGDSQGGMAQIMYAHMNK
jgi:hypothetical protein